MKAIAATALIALSITGHALADEDEAQQFAEGLQRGLEQSREISCAPGSVCFARLSPEVQKQRYCDLHPSYACLQSMHGSNNGGPSIEAGVVSHVYINGVYVTCIGTGTGVNCRR